MIPYFITMKLFIFITTFLSQLFTNQIVLSQSNSVNSLLKQEQEDNKKKERELGLKKMEASVLFLNQVPFCYQEKGEIKGIEADILRMFSEWTLGKKNIEIALKFEPYSNFEKFIDTVALGNTMVIGAGTVSIKENRLKDLQFSPPYMNNVSVMITNGTIPTINNKGDVRSVLKSMKAIVTKDAVHVSYIEDLKKQYLPELEIEYSSNPLSVIETIGSDTRYFGYVDIITFWQYLKTSDRYIKMQRIFNVKDEKFAFVLPKNAEFQGLLTEFFDSGFGVTSTIAYRSILEKYLGYEVISTVAIEN